MADPRNQYGANYTDEYGNPIGHAGNTYGNHPVGTNVGATGLHPGVTDMGGHMQQERPGHAGMTTLRRSGSSSSSSSSEDDGQGGRRKKGLKEKIKEKLPGGHKNNPEAQAHVTPGATGVYGGTGHAGTTGAYGAGHGGGYEPGHAGPGHAGTATGAYGTGHAEPEKKGFMEKIKEKLPGHH